MKKFSLITLVALALAVVFVFTACTSSGILGGGKVAKKVFDSKTYTEEADKTYSSSVRIGEFDGAEINNYSHNLVLFRKVDGTSVIWYIYDTDAERTIKSYYESETTKYSFNLRSNYIADSAYYFVKTRSIDETNGDRYTYDLVDCTGNTIDSYSNKINDDEFYDTAEDIISFNSKYYRIQKGGTISSFKTVSELGDELPDIDQKVNGYYYAFNGKKVTVYDDNLDLVYFYEYPAYANGDYSLLNNGNVFVQYYVEKFDADKDYDFVANMGAGMKKYDLFQKVINVKKGKISDVSNKYYIEYASGRYDADGEDMFRGVNGKYVNFCYAYPIENKYLNMAESNVLIASMSDKGAVGDILNRTVAGEMYFSIISNDRVLIRDNSGNNNLYDYSGKLIGNVSNADDRTDSMIIGATNIYDYNLNSLYDFASNGYAIEQVLDDSILLSGVSSGKTAIKIFTKNNGLREICDDDNNFYYINSGFFYVKRGDTTYTLYNAQGNIIMEGSSAFSVTRNDYFAIARTINEGKNNFYILH